MLEEFQVVLNIDPLEPIEFSDRSFEQATGGPTYTEYAHRCKWESNYIQ